MLPKRHRSLSSKEISELFENDSQTCGNRFFRVLWQEDGAPSARFAVITPSKFHKSAVLRNKLRRRVYRYLSQEFSDWTRGVRVAILVKTSAQSCSPEAFKRQLENAFKEFR